MPNLGNDEHPGPPPIQPPVDGSPGLDLPLPGQPDAANASPGGVPSPGFSFGGGEFCWNRNGDHDSSNEARFAFFCQIELTDLKPIKSSGHSIKYYMLKPNIVRIFSTE